MGNIVAIVGRPNVGKSTLFNRLIADNVAIVDDLPGITVDRHYEIATWGEHTFTLIDTGGYSEDKDQMATKVCDQVVVALAEAHVILFVVDCKVGITPLDRSFAALLRKVKKPVLLVANKVDNAARSFNAHECHSLGLGEVHEVSAIHGDGTGDLLDSLVKQFPEERAEEQECDVPKVAFVGRPNGGKSTLVNALLGEERSVVHKDPHTTRTPVYSVYRLYNKELILIDTAGIAKKQYIKRRSLPFYALIRSIKAIEQAEIALLVIDAREGLTNQDKNILSLAFRKKKGVILLVNKWDLMDKGEQAQLIYRQKLLKQLPYVSHLPILFTSGLHRHHLYQIIERALKVYENRHRKVSTPTLNKVLQSAIIQKPAPSVKGKAIKINYATQLSLPYPAFAIFCNTPQDVPTHYKRYLEKQLRLYSNFEGVPILLVFKKK